MKPTGIDLEIARNRLRGIAEEMGIVLRRTAYSPNIKERADCSAAVFTASGDMLAQAEHIPVHLGAMPASVLMTLYRSLIATPSADVCSSHSNGKLAESNASYASL